MTETLDRPAPLPPARPTSVVMAGAILFVVVLAHLPLLMEHVGHLWLKPHYRFVPFVLLGAVVLAWTRWKPETTLSGGSGWLSVLLLVLGLGLFGGAVAMTSSWLGAVAFLVNLAAFTYALGGRAACEQLWPAWVLLWLAIPPPMELDRELIQSLQSGTARWSSAALDVLGVYHVMAGNVVELDGRRLLVEDACSGINSLFSVLACVLFLIFLMRCPPVRAGLLLGAALFWVLLANVARVTGIALLQAQWSVDVSTGWRHELFGLLLFGLAVALTWSTERFLSFLFDLPEPKADTPVKPELSPVRGGVVWVPSVAVVILLALSATHLVGTARAETGPSHRLDHPEGLQAESLPEMLGRWKRHDFQKVSRDVGSYFGDHSLVWLYRQGERTATISLDYPFPVWHDLTRCYTGQGWRIEDQEVHDHDDLPGGLVAVRFSKPAYRRGYLLFCEFNAAGEPLPARRGAAYMSLFRHAGILRHWQGEGAAADPRGPVYQWQVMIEGHAELTDAERAEWRESFIRARGLVKRSWR